MDNSNFLGKAVTMLSESAIYQKNCRICFLGIYLGKRKLKISTKTTFQFKLKSTDWISEDIVPILFVNNHQTYVSKVNQFCDKSSISPLKLQGNNIITNIGSYCLLHHFASLKEYKKKNDVIPLRKWLTVFSMVSYWRSKVLESIIRVFKKILSPPSLSISFSQTINFNIPPHLHFVLWNYQCLQYRNYVIYNNDQESQYTFPPASYFYCPRTFNCNNIHIYRYTYTSLTGLAFVIDEKLFWYQ